jgi:hypothetical protein
VSPIESLRAALALWDRAKGSPGDVTTFDMRLDTMFENRAIAMQRVIRAAREVVAQDSFESAHEEAHAQWRAYWLGK